MNGIHIDSEPDRKLLRKLFQGKASKDEENLVIHWFCSFRHDGKLNLIFKEHWDELNPGLMDQDYNTFILLDRIHQNLHSGYGKEYPWITLYGKNVGIN